MEILSIFNESGERTGTLIRGVNYSTDAEKAHYLTEGYIEISEDDWQHYIGNYGDGENGRGYIRDPETGKPVSAPAHVPSREEQATLLFNECQQDLKAIDAQIISAIAANDLELIEELRQEREERIAEYQKALEELEEGE